MMTLVIIALKGYMRGSLLAMQKATPIEAQIAVI
jgi:hypothetical protein